MIKEIITTISWSVLSFLSSLFSVGSGSPAGVPQIKSPVASPSAYVNPQKAPNPLEVEYSGVKYSVYYAVVKDVQRINLFPNFKEKATSSELVKSKNCSLLTNGGFYSKEGTPLGLFISQGWKTSNAYFSPLLNGYFTIYDGAALISSTQPTGEIKSAVQSGPILLESGQFKPLKIKNDKTARRTTVSLTKDGEVVFAVFYDTQNNLQGPYLSDLPKYLNDFKVASGLKITDSINLDGGSASAFYDGDFFLPEFNPIGSYFCIR